MRTVVVTGGSRGIGRAVVARFAKGGDKVYFTYHANEEAAAETADAYGASAVRCPQSDAEAIAAAVDRIVGETGRVDVLVNSAGVSRDQYLMMMPPEDWDRVIDTNLNGLYRWCKAVSRRMLEARSGAIVTVASVSGLVGIAGQTNYAATKGAQIAFSRSLAAELGPKGIRVNTVVPGFIDTDMTARMPRQIKQQNLDRILLRRFGRADEVAAAVSFLASEDATYIVGQTLVVDGGLSATVAFSR
jgi:3-oxoacyl-[acyl-carrier protein] reductase